VLASLGATVAGRTLPTLSAFKDMYWISAGTALLAFVLVVFVPARGEGAQLAAPSGAGAETVVQGRVLTGDRRGMRQSAIVVITQLDGEPVDWARADSDGKYSVALPGSGRYVVIANARGWAPRAKIVDFQRGLSELHVQLTDELAITGSASCAGSPVRGSLVMLHGADGKFVTTSRTDDAGRFTFPLPPAGPYLVTAVTGDQQRAGTAKVVVSALGAAVDIQVP
jgi:hypothetical protein